MDLLAQHEAFLRAIFDAPDDDTPRLVYADFLQENGEEDRAELIRVQCEMWRVRALPDGHPERARLAPLLARLSILTARLVTSQPALIDLHHLRGFREPGYAYLSADTPRDLDAFRHWVVFNRPEWFGATAVRSMGQFDPVLLGILFGAAAFARVTGLDFAGEEVRDEDDRGPAFTTYHLVPAITTAGVAALAQHRGLRRIERLDLRNNDLDNDAARALVASPYLGGLKQLRLLEGNRLRGKVWQQVIARFGGDVVE